MMGEWVVCQKGESKNDIRSETPRTRPSGASIWAGITLTTSYLLKKEPKGRECGTEDMVRMEILKA